jgi:cytochrome oxidase Cu insertion factor (SCO1/SenC/PrrC family)
VIPLVPVHAALVSRLDASHAVVRLDAVAGTLPAGVRSVRIDGASGLRAGDEFDALATGTGAGQTLELHDARVAERFAAGTPNALVTHVFAVGDRLPEMTLVDQRGAPFRLGDLGGKTTLLAFVFTRCPDRSVCPAITGKFAYLQKQLDPQHFHLIEVTLDPSFDSPAVLARYGATFAADPARWSLLTGRASDVKDLMDSFGISSIADGSANFVHDDELAVIGPDGRIKDLIPTAGWDPNDAIAVARDAAGLASNPFRRFELASVAGIVALCGGSASTALVVLDSSVFLLGVAILGSLLVWWGRRIFSEN